MQAAPGTRTGSLFTMSSPSKVRVGEARQTPVTGQLTQLNEARQREAAQRRSAQAPPQAARRKAALNMATLKKSCAYIGGEEAAQTHAGSQIPRLLPAPAHIEARVVEFGVRDAIGRVPIGVSVRERIEARNSERDAVNKYWRMLCARPVFFGAQAHTNEPDDRECDSKRRNLDGEGANHVFTEQFPARRVFLRSESELYEPTCIYACSNIYSWWYIAGYRSYPPHIVHHQCKDRSLWLALGETVKKLYTHPHTP